MLVHADANAFNKLLENKGTFVVDFFATWCGPCKMLGAVLEKVAPEYDFDILKIDIDENVKLAEEYEVMVVPTLLFVKDGEIIHRESGFFSKDKFRALIDAYLNKNLKIPKPLFIILYKIKAVVFKLQLLFFI